MYRSSSSSDSASNYISNQNANTFQKQKSGLWNGLDYAQTTGVRCSNFHNRLAGELQDESAVGVSDFCTPSLTEVDTDDIYAKYLHKINFRQSGDQHSEQTHFQSDSDIKYCTISNLTESDASMRRMYPKRAHYVR